MESKLGKTFLLLEFYSFQQRIGISRVTTQKKNHDSTMSALIRFLNIQSILKQRTKALSVILIQH